MYKDKPYRQIILIFVLAMYMCCFLFSCGEKKNSTKILVIDHDKQISEKSSLQSFEKLFMEYSRHRGINYYEAKNIIQNSNPNSLFNI